MYKSNYVLPLVRLIHEAVYKVGIRLLPIKWQLNGCPLSPTASLNWWRVVSRTGLTRTYKFPSLKY